MSTFASHRRSAAVLASLALMAGLFTACAPAATVGSAPGVNAMPAMAPAHDHSGSGNNDNNNKADVPATQVAFKEAMRMLWVQHMEWTRLAVVNFAAGSAGFPTTAGRLLKNQEDIGNAIKPFYGEAAGNQLTTLLKAHITEFVGLFQAAKAGDASALAAAKVKVYANAQEIADFLAAANPKSWPQATMRAMMKGHIDQTIVYGGDELTGQYAEGIVVYDEAEAHMVLMADDLSAGIIKAFPKKFR
ncbi:hypothetical protein [Specibacter sp. RAF43]|uniref:hypothetical protein n=1 Tax=Specibacter sp. RAF43 TaxID=3233057 RepID=UPI003F9BF77E